MPRAMEDAIKVAIKEPGERRVHGVDHHLLGDAAHFGDPPLEGVEILVVRSDDVIDHGADSFNQTGR